MGLRFVHTLTQTSVGLAVALAAMLFVPTATTAHAQFLPPAGQDFGWTTVGSPGNAPYDGRFVPRAQNAEWTIGRGRVDYTYRIQTAELTVGQWLEFANSVASNPTTAAWINARTFLISNGARAPIGVVQDFDYTGPGTRSMATSPGVMLQPVEISWRESALICNWLHNDRRNDLASITTGAYDANTWGERFLPNGFRVTLDGDRLPGARYFIPSQDEWMKAAHWDEVRVATDGSAGDWALYSFGDGNGGGSPAFQRRGLMDVGNERPEWTDTSIGGSPGSINGRVARDGAISLISSPITDGRRVDSPLGRNLMSDSYMMYGRLGTIVPAPGAVAGLVLGSVFVLRRRR